MVTDRMSRKRNGTIDVGMAQINSIHFREMAQRDIAPERMLPPSLATHVPAWHIKRPCCTMTTFALS